VITKFTRRTSDRKRSTLMRLHPRYQARDTARNLFIPAPCIAETLRGQDAQRHFSQERLEQLVQISSTTVTLATTRTTKLGEEPNLRVARRAHRESPGPHSRTGDVLLHRQFKSFGGGVLSLFSFRKPKGKDRKEVLN
jgi:hypothetical protein